MPRVPLCVKVLIPAGAGPIPRDALNGKERVRPSATLDHVVTEKLPNDGIGLIQCGLADAGFVKTR